MSKGTLCLFICIVMLFSMSAFAVDGVVLINQASITAAGGFPYIINQSGSYKLSGNLIVSTNVSVIVITVDNVTLDLNGFSITGPITCSGTPTTCTGSAGTGVSSSKDNIAVKNGSIIGMESGAYLFGTGELVEEIRARANGSIGIFVKEGKVRHSDTSQNGFAGIEADYGILESCMARDNGVYGLIGVYSTITGNTSLRNEIGLYTVDSVYGSNSLQNNTLLDIDDVAGSVTQHNNICTNGGVC